MPQNDDATMENNHLGYIARTCVKSFLDIHILKPYVLKHKGLQCRMPAKVRDLIDSCPRRWIPMFILYIYDIDPVTHELDLSRRHIVYHIGPLYTVYRKEGEVGVEKNVACTDSYDFDKKSYKVEKLIPQSYFFEDEAHADVARHPYEYFNNSHSPQDEFLYNMTRYRCPTCGEPEVKAICTISKKHCCEKRNHECKISKCVPISKIVDLDRMPIRAGAFPWSLQDEFVRRQHKIGNEYIMFGDMQLPLVHENEFEVNFLEYLPTLALDIETITVDENYEPLEKTEFIAISLLWYDGKGNVTDARYVGTRLPDVDEHPDHFTPCDDGYHVVHFPPEHNRAPLKCKIVSCSNEREAILKTIRAMVSGPLYDGLLTYNGNEFDLPNLFATAMKYGIDFQGMLMPANHKFITTPDIKNFEQNKERLQKYKAGEFIRDLNLSVEALPNCVSIDLIVHSGNLSLKDYSNKKKLKNNKVDLAHEDIPKYHYAKNFMLIMYCLTDTALCGDLFHIPSVREVNLDFCILIEPLVCYNWDSIIGGKKTDIVRASNYSQFTNSNFVTPGAVRPKEKRAKLICQQICEHFYLDRLTFSPDGSHQDDVFVQTMVDYYNGNSTYKNPNKINYRHYMKCCLPDENDRYETNPITLQEIGTLTYKFLTKNRLKTLTTADLLGILSVITSRNRPTLSKHYDPTSFVSKNIVLDPIVKEFLNKTSYDWGGLMKNNVKKNQIKFVQAKALIEFLEFIVFIKSYNLSVKENMMVCYDLFREHFSEMNKSDFLYVKDFIFEYMCDFDTSQYGFNASMNNKNDDIGVYILKQKYYDMIMNFNGLNFRSWEYQISSSADPVKIIYEAVCNGVREAREFLSNNNNNNNDLIHEEDDGGEDDDNPANSYYCDVEEEEVS